eukprot:Lithocolla_globosa_v1_NODE_380_length_4230_cov_10.111377.p1 type:complete len:436 gc:universal NODE_380_length_4230_cov_10.111377:1410-103(-)
MDEKSEEELERKYRDYQNKHPESNKTFEQWKKKRTQKKASRVIDDDLEESSSLIDDATSPTPRRKKTKSNLGQETASEPPPSFEERDGNMEMTQIASGSPPPNTPAAVGSTAVGLAPAPSVPWTERYEKEISMCTSYAIYYIPCLICLALFLMLIFIPMAHNGVPYDSHAFVINRFTEEIDRSEIYEYGKYWIGATNKFLLFPRTVVPVTEHINIITTSGNEMVVVVSYQYQLRKDRLVDVLDFFGPTGYHDQFRSVAVGGIKNAAPMFTVEDYIQNRAIVSDVFEEAVRNALEEIGGTIPPYKFHFVEFQLNSKVGDQFLAKAIQDQDNLKELFSQQTELIRAETQLQTERILSEIQVVEETAEATGERMIDDAESERFKVVQQATGEGLSGLFQTLNMTNPLDQDLFLQYYYLIDSDLQLILGDSPGIIIDSL